MVYCEIIFTIKNWIEIANWVLHYVKKAYADTDVPDSVPEFLSQRRRWLNGSLFAGFYALA
ncbi:Chitin synthase, class 2, partial [Clydaea vesicula]